MTACIGYGIYNDRCEFDALESNCFCSRCDEMRKRIMIAEDVKKKNRQDRINTNELTAVRTKIDR